MLENARFGNRAFSLVFPPVSARVEWINGNQMICQQHLPCRTLLARRVCSREEASHFVDWLIFTFLEISPTFLAKERDKADYF